MSCKRNTAITEYQAMREEGHEVYPPEMTKPMAQELVDAGILEHARDGAELAELVLRDAPEAERAEVARDLFGIGLPDPDFDRVIEQALEGER